MKSTLCFTVLLATSSIALAIGPPISDPKVIDSTKAQEPVDPGLTLKQMQQAASKHNAHELLILEPSKTDTNQWILMQGLAIGVERSSGDILNHQDDLRLRDGMWLFHEGGIITSTDGYTMQFDEPTLVIVGTQNIAGPVQKQFTSGGSVECGSGYYACCGRNEYGQWRAKCIPDGTSTPGGEDYPEECTNGGPGSTGCSNGTNAFLVYEP